MSPSPPLCKLHLAQCDLAFNLGEIMERDLESDIDDIGMGGRGRQMTNQNETIVKTKIERMKIKKCNIIQTDYPLYRKWQISLYFLD